MTAGERLRVFLEAASMSQKEAARRMKRPVPVICEIVNGKKSITAKTAIRLESLTGINALDWLMYQAKDQLSAARKRARK